jgi:hypothetical protein
MIDFQFTWEDAVHPEVRGPELVVTWASMSIFCNSQLVTALEQGSGSESRSHITLPLYPVAEWIVLNWWHLLHEPFVPFKQDHTEYEMRHNLTFAGEGYALPSLRFEPNGNTIKVTWEKIHLLHSKVRFCNTGKSVVSFNSFRKSLHVFVERVVQRLYAKGISDTLLQEEWKVIQGMKRGEMQFCALTAAAGLDPYNITAEQTRQILDAYSKVPSDLLTEFFISCNPHRIRDEADKLLRVGRLSRPYSIMPLNRLQKKLQRRMKKSTEPWREGYELAKILRDVLEIQDSPWSDVFDIKNMFGLSGAEFSEIVAYANLSSQVSESMVQEKQTPYGNSETAASQAESEVRFALFRALYDYLIPPLSSSGPATRLYFDNQKRNRAFAAELLAPAALLRKRIKSITVSEAEIGQLADKFLVDPKVIRQQVEQHQIARVVAY